MRDITVETVSLGYKSKNEWFIRDFNICIGKREIYCLYYLNDIEGEIVYKLLLGLEKPSEGYARILGRKIPDERNGIIGRIGFMNSHHHSLYGNLTVEENLKLYFNLFGNTYNEDTELIKLFKIDTLLKTRVSRLSDENKARLCIVRALLQNPDVVIMNNPLFLFDKQERKKIWNLFIEMSLCRGMTFVILTKDAEEAVCLGNRAGVIAGGKKPKEFSCDLIDSTCNTYIEIHVDDMPKAAFILENICGITNYQCIGENQIFIYQHADPLGKINKSLIENGICVSKFNPVKESLSHCLIDMKGENDG